ncbi:MAG TPA: hypothetical protein PLF26_08615 [Blastocatellia bacterium]|nr:hypothetical protein [Blastocatellia bacterium]
MPDEAIATTRSVTIPVRPGRYAYVRVGPDGSTSTVHVSTRELDRGKATVDVTPGESIVEIALSSTSDPDLDPARGVVWAEGAPR